MAKHPRLPETFGPNGSDSSNAAPNYAVGYRRPPVHTQYTRGGRRGNPKGRPKGQRNVRTLLDATLNEKVTVREGKRTRSVTKLHAMILRMTNDAVSGNAKAQSNVITLARSLGLMGEPQETTNTEPLTADDLALMVDFLARNGNLTEPTQAPEGTDKPETEAVEPPSKENKEIKP
jgi:hypothetical protein